MKIRPVFPSGDAGFLDWGGYLRRQLILILQDVLVLAKRLLMIYNRTNVRFIREGAEIWTYLNMRNRKH